MTESKDFNPCPAVMRMHTHTHTHIASEGHVENSNEVQDGRMVAGDSAGGEEESHLDPDRRPSSPM